MTASLTLAQVNQALEGVVHREHGERRPVNPRHVMEIPSQLPKANIPTVSEMEARRQAELLKQIEEESVEQQQGACAVKTGATPKEKILGAFAATKGFASKSFLTAKLHTTNTVKNSSFSRDLDAFLSEFGDLVRKGPTALVSCHEGYVMCEGEPHLVDIYVSTSHLCVAGKAVYDAIPLRDIASIYPSVSLATTELTPHFVHVPDPIVKPNAVQVYTQASTVYQFLGIAHSIRHAVSSFADVDPCILFYASLDDAWRNRE